MLIMFSLGIDLKKKRHVVDAIKHKEAFDAVCLNSLEPDASAKRDASTQMNLTKTNEIGMQIDFCQKNDCTSRFEDV